MRRAALAVLGGLFLFSLTVVGQGCCHDYSGHDLLYSASASCDEVVTKSYVQEALKCSCHNRAHAECRCQHRSGVDGQDCWCKRVDKFDGRCRCDWRPPYCLCGYYE